MPKKVELIRFHGETDNMQIPLHFTELASTCNDLRLVSSGHNYNEIKPASRSQIDRSST